MASVRKSTVGQAKTAKPKTQEEEPFARRVLNAINLVRNQPHSIIPLVEEQMNLVDADNVIHQPNRDPIQLEEGREAYREAIQALRKMPQTTTLKVITWSELLEKAAVDHQKDLTNTGQLDAQGSDGSSYKERIERYCRWGGSIFQALDFGERKDPREVVVAWLVDDGNPRRTSRTNLLSVNQRHFAASFGSHPEAENCCVGVFAAQVVPLAVDEGEELGMRGTSNLPDGANAVPDNPRSRKLRNMDWKKFAKQIFDLQNKIRTNPKSFVAYLERSLKRFHGKIYTTEDGHSAIRTEEGQFAFVEAIEFLRNQKAIPALKWSDELARAAKDHCNDLGATGQMTSIGTDGSLPTDRMARYCMINETWAESSCFGSVTAEEVMEQMLVNDGQAHRGFRKNIFNKVLTVVGIASGHHASGGSIAQFEYAKGILKEGQQQQINVTVTDKVPEKLIKKMQTMGIDTNRIKFNVTKDDSKANEAPERTKQFQVESASLETATKQVRNQMHKSKTSVVSQPVLKPRTPATRPGVQRLQNQRLSQNPQSILKVGSKSEISTNSITASNRTTRAAASGRGSSLNAQKSQGASYLTNNTSTAQSSSKTQLNKPPLVTNSRQAADQSKKFGFGRSSTTAANVPTATVSLNSKVMHGFKHSMSSVVSNGSLPDTEEASLNEYGMKKFSQSGVQRSNSTVNSGPKQRRRRGDRSGDKTAPGSFIGRQNSSSSNQPDLLAKATEIKIQLDSEKAQKEQKKTVKFGTDIINGPYDPAGSPGQNQGRSSSFALGSENNSCLAEEASSQAFGSSGRMSRKERQEKKLREAQAKSNLENRLPASIHQNSREKQSSYGLTNKSKPGFGKAKTVLPDMDAGSEIEPMQEKIYKKSKTEFTSPQGLNFDVMDDPDYPPEAVNSNIIVEEIEMNGRIQKIYKKTYYLIDGKTINITRMEQA